MTLTIGLICFPRSQPRSQGSLSTGRGETLGMRFVKFLVLFAYLIISRDSPNSFISLSSSLQLVKDAVYRHLSWIAFWGSVLGAIVGCLAELASVYIKGP